jgi:hypothetical protein
LNNLNVQIKLKSFKNNLLICIEITKPKNLGIKIDFFVFFTTVFLALKSDEPACRFVAAFRGRIVGAIISSSIIQ